MPEQAVPKKLYKYRSLSKPNRDNSLDILLHNRLWVAKPTSFNDPFDCRLPVKTSYSATDWKAMIPRLFPGVGFDVSNWDTNSEPPEKLRKLLNLMMSMLELPTDATRKIDDLLNDIAAATIDRATQQIDEVVGVLTLSELSNHILLWANYADSHRGICLEFDVTTADFPRLCPVRYANEHAEYDEVGEALALHQLSIVRDPKILADMAYLAATRALPRNAVFYWSGLWLYSKSEVWSYEREWRSICHRSGHISFPSTSLTAVIFGCAARDEDVLTICELLQQRSEPVSIYRARKKSGDYGLDIVKI